MAQVTSLQHKFCGDEQSKELTAFIIQLMRGKEVAIYGGARGTIGQRITAMFRDAQKVIVKLYIFNSQIIIIQLYSLFFIFLFFVM